ncbi:hypothetical protein LINPERHAP2_LOCUS14069 [Linum perenne]
METIRGKGGTDRKFCSGRTRWVSRRTGPLHILDRWWRNKRMHEHGLSWFCYED